MQPGDQHTDTLGGRDSAPPLSSLPRSLQPPLTTIPVCLSKTDSGKQPVVVLSLRTTVFWSFRVEHLSPADTMALYRALRVLRDAIRLDYSGYESSPLLLFSLALPCWFHPCR